MESKKYTFYYSSQKLIYLTEATKLLKEKGNFREDVLKHGWEHINSLWGYTFDMMKVASLDAPILLFNKIKPKIP